MPDSEPAAPRVDAAAGAVAALREELDRALAREAEQGRLAAEYRSVVEAMPQIVWITRPDGWHTDFNQQWLDFTGLTLEESLGHGWNPPFHPEDRARAAARWEQATRTGEPYEIEYRLRRHDGVYHWMLGRAVPLRDESGAIVKWFGTCTDIEDLKRAETRLAAQAQLLDLSQDAILVLDLERRVTYWNGGAERVLGWTGEQAVGRTLTELACSAADQLTEPLEALCRDGQWSGDLTFSDRDGEQVMLESRWTLLHDPAGAPRAFLAVNTDVTERRRTEAELLRVLHLKATQDPLTGLANRARLVDRLQALLSGPRTHGVAVAFLDLDGFKGVNDRWGHRVGDAVLVQVARRIRGSVREEDLVARIGGDEFVVVAEVPDLDEAHALRDRLAAATRADVPLDGTATPAVAVAASVGVAFAGPADPASVEELLARADDAMYCVKSRSRGGAGLAAG